MKISLLPVGSLVTILQSGPYSSCTGTIVNVEVIELDGERALPFYLVALRDFPQQDPLWFEHEAILEVVRNSVAR